MTGPTVPSDQNGHAVPPEAVDKAAEAVSAEYALYGTLHGMPIELVGDTIKQIVATALAASGLVDPAVVRAEVANEIADKIHADLPESGPRVTISQYREGIIEGMNRARRIAASFAVPESVSEAAGGEAR